MNDERHRTFLSLSAAAGAAPQAPGLPVSMQRPGTRHLPGSWAGGLGSTARSNPSKASSASASSSDPIVAAIEGVNRAFKLHGLREYYEDPRPHVSVAWLLGDAEHAARSALARPEAQRAAQAVAAAGWCTCAGRIVCKAGQKTYVVWEGRQ